MRVELRVDQESPDEQPVLITVLYTRSEEEYLNGSEEGIYNCASTMPTNTKQLISVIEQSINGCLKTHFEKCIEIFDDLMKKNTPMMEEVHKLILKEFK